MPRAISNISCTVITTYILVQALREVFTPAFSEEQFQGLRITPEYPMSKDKYPAIVVEPDINVVRNAGIGHQELFQDPNGLVRLWQHRMYSGSLNLTVLAYSTKDRDILVDQLIELFSFGRIVPELSEFFYYIWGEAETRSGLHARYQLELNLDEINIGGASISPTPWTSEDELLYSKTVSMEMLGGFYNALRTIPVDYLHRIDFYAKLYGDTDPRDVNWVSDILYADTDTIEGSGFADSPE